MYEDPLIVFNPPLSVIQSALKHKKYEATILLQRISTVPSHASWLKEDLENHHKRSVDEIRQLEYRLNSRRRTGSWAVPRAVGAIDSSAIARAKQYEITELYGPGLRRTGQRLIGRCPFHEDGTASFVIYPNNTWHCFGCQAGSDAIDFVMRRDGLTFIEAVRKLI